MSTFTGPLTITQLDNWRRWKIESELTYEVGALGSGRVITIPKDFVTDGASIPRPLWWLLPTWGSYSRAAVIHDYLYDRLNGKRPHKEAQNRRRADAVFREAMRVSGVTWPVRQAIWLAVRAFGGIALFKKLAVA